MENKNIGHKKWLLESRLLLFATDKSVWYGVILQSGVAWHTEHDAHTHTSIRPYKRDKSKKKYKNNNTICVYATQNGIKKGKLVMQHKHFELGMMIQAHLVLCIPFYFGLRKCVCAVIVYYKPQMCPVSILIH